MDYNRDFKGIWIPKEIWLNESLSALDKMIYAEIDSLDTDGGCVAGNDYLAKFCQCSDSKVSRSISTLVELGLIEVVSFDGRQRTLRVVKNARQTCKKSKADLQKKQLSNSNIDNSTTSSTIDKNNSNELLENFPTTAPAPAKPNLYTRCVAMINDFCIKYNYADTIHDLLLQYLNMRLEVRDKPLYANQFKGMLNKLVSMCEENHDTISEVIQQSIDRAYLSFYPVKKHAYSENRFNEHGEVISRQYTEEELAELSAIADDRIKSGKRAYF